MKKISDIVVYSILVVFVGVMLHAVIAVEPEEDALESETNHISTELVLEDTESDMIHQSGFAGISVEIGNIIKMTCIKNTPPFDDAFCFDTWVPFLAETDLVDERDQSTYTKLVERDIPVKNRKFDKISMDQIDRIVDYTFMAAGDLSFETQVAIISVIFNMLEKYDIQQVTDLSLPIRVGFDDYPNRMADQNVIDSFRDKYQFVIDDVKTAVECVINDDPRVVKVPKNVVEFSQSKFRHRDMWESDCVDGFYFYYEEEGEK